MYLEETYVLNKIDGEEEICGIAVLGEYVHVIRRKSVSIEKFSTVLTLIHRKTIQIEEYRSESLMKKQKLFGQKRSSKHRSQRFEDITSCPINNCLYITESEKGLVFRLDCSSYRIQAIWNVFGKPLGISATTIGNVLVSCYNPDHSGGDRFREYTCEGNQVRVIKTQLQGYPRFGFQLDTDRWLLCCEEIYSTREHGVGNLVYVANDNGHVIPGLETKHFDGACHIAIDSRKQLIVAESSKNRIVLMDSNMGTVKQILVQSHQGAINPVRVCFEEASGQLYVGLLNGALFSYKVGSSV